jgi:hypothetical protein
MWIKQAGMWMKLGNKAKATEILLKIENHQKQARGGGIGQGAGQVVRT